MLIHPHPKFNIRNSKLRIHVKESQIVILSKECCNNNNNNNNNTNNSHNIPNIPNIHNNFPNKINTNMDLNQDNFPNTQNNIHHNKKFNKIMHNYIIKYHIQSFNKKIIIL